MSLINCPGCGQNISDKAKQCPHCLYRFSEKETIICTECGISYEKDLFACPKCGCPKPGKLKLKKKNIVLIIAVFLIIVSCALGIGAVRNKKQQEIQKQKQESQKQEFILNTRTVSYTMIDGAADAEHAGNLIHDVWSNAIYKRHDDETDKFTMKNGIFVDDFNDALNALYFDEEFKKSVSEIMDNQSETMALMKKLNNPPKECEELYALVMECYENYLKLTRLVTSPTGSLNSFSENFQKYDEDTVNSYNKLDIHLG